MEGDRRGDYGAEFYVFEEKDDHSSIKRMDKFTNRGGRNARRGFRIPPRPFDMVDRNLGNNKMKMLTYQGRNDQKAYLEWEAKVDLIFECHNYMQEKKSS